MNKTQKQKFQKTYFCLKMKLIFLILISGILRPIEAQSIDENYVNSINSFIKLMNKTVRGISQNFFIFSDTYYMVKTGEENITEKFKRHSFAGSLKSEYSDAKIYTEVYMLRNELDNSHSKLIQITDSVHLVYK